MAAKSFLLAASSLTEFLSFWSRYNEILHSS
ncbi:unnamed protein product [Arabidopsis thaliana]|uniref:Uncharacterized protein n=1 Tax=Arabidopsis thaliana TaxID=3702 RepID=A0A5S9YB95_ARATH|nr:unnamed protein product [Arabidopsis thaliana]